MHSRIAELSSPLVEPVAYPLGLSYCVVAYQTLHRSAQVRPRQTVLLIGASGGIGTALLQLGRLARPQAVRPGVTEQARRWPIMARRRLTTA